jgi:hypothetical protein
MACAAPCASASWHLASLPGGGDQLQAQRLGPLAGDQAHAAGGGVEQHLVAGLQAFDRQRLLQQVLRGQALEHHGRAGLEAMSSGSLHTVRAGITRSSL